MLPDYPKVKEEFDVLFTRHVRTEVLRRAPILSQVKRMRQHEGDRWDFSGVDGHEDGGGYAKFESAIELTRSEMRSLTLDGVLAKAGQIAEEFARAQSETLFARVAEATESTGNVVEVGGRLTKEHFLELVRKVETDFDPVTQKPRHPSIVIHPDTWAQIEGEVRRWNDDPGFLAELEKIEDEQRRAWRGRESDRRLVD
jgi:hypothetical protein